MLCVSEPCGLEREREKCTLLLLHLPASGSEIYRVTPFGSREQDDSIAKREGNRCLFAYSERCLFHQCSKQDEFSCKLLMAALVIILCCVCLRFWACTFLSGIGLICFCFVCVADWRRWPKVSECRSSSERIRDCGAKLAVALILVCLWSRVLFKNAARTNYFLERGLEFVEWTTRHIPRLELTTDLGDIHPST